MVGIPVRPSTWPGLLIDIETTSSAMEGKGGRLAQPGQPRGLICRSKMLLQLALRVQLSTKPSQANTTIDYNQGGDIVVGGEEG
jgi:hypothetical protein